MDSESNKPATITEQFDINGLVNEDDELNKIHADRIAQLQEEKEKRAKKVFAGHGTVTEIQEGEFLEIVTKTAEVVCHFFHPDFERCKLMDKHIARLAPRFFETRFIKVNAQDCPFFTVKLEIKILPCVVVFKAGVSVDRIIGFDELGAKDGMTFETIALENRLLASGVITPPQAMDDPEDSGVAKATKLRRGFGNVAKTASDEDSDFDEC
eukprot:gene14946-21002_t